MLKTLLAVCGALALVSCTTIRVSPITTENVTVKVDRGRSIPTYEDSATEMAVVTESRSAETMFKVTLKNKADKEWRVADTDFTVEVSDDGKKWRSERVFTSQEYYERQRNLYTASVAMAVMGDVIIADQPTVVTTRTTRVWGGDRVVIQQTRVYRSPGYRTIWLTEDYAYSGAAWLNALQDNLFYSKDLAPQEEYFGFVFADDVDSKYYRITLKREGAKNPSVEFQRVKKRFNPFWPD